jgi:hypothetical protein
MDREIKRIADSLPDINLVEVLEDIEKYLPYEGNNQPRFVPQDGYENTFYLYYAFRTGINLVFDERSLKVSKPCRAAEGTKSRIFEWCDPKNGYDPKVIADYILHG